MYDIIFACNVTAGRSIKTEKRIRACQVLVEGENESCITPGNGENGLELEEMAHSFVNILETTSCIL